VAKLGKRKASSEDLSRPEKKVMTVGDVFDLFSIKNQLKNMLSLGQSV
jgi:hypothetical protein